MALAGVDIADRDHPVIGQGGVLADTAGQLAGDRRGVVLALDRDDDVLLVGAVIRGQVQRVADEVGAAQCLHIGVAVAQHITPGAGRLVVGEVAVGAVGRPGLGMALTGVVIAARDHPVIGQGGVLADTAGQLAGDHRGVVLALDRDDDVLLVGAVIRGQVQRVADEVGAAQCLHIGVAVAQRITPGAGRLVVGEVAVGAVGRPGMGMALAGVDIADRDHPVIGQGGVLADTAGQLAGDRRGVVLALDRDDDVLLVGAV